MNIISPHKPFATAGAVTAHPSPVAPMKVTVAPNGARRQREDHPNIPLDARSLAACAAECHAAGADEIHLHVRDGAGRHSLDPGRYREAMTAIADAAPCLSVQMTTESAGIYGVDAQLALLQDLVPSRASVSVREALRAPDLVPRFYGFCADAGIRVQHILYDSSDLAALRRMLKSGEIPDGMRDVLLVLGRYAPPTPARPEDAAGFIRALNGEFPNWTVCAFGPTEHAVAEFAIRLGGHVRVGFENNIWRSDGTLAQSNAESVAGVVAAARAFGRPLLSESVKR